MLDFGPELAQGFKPFTDAEVAHLLGFVGYGRLDAPVWFIGMEEGGGGEDNLRARLKFCKVMDLAEAHIILGITKHHVGRRVIQPNWAGMCRVMLALNGIEPTREAIRAYQAERLGRADGETLLTEIMPLPKPNVSVWEYGSLLPQFASRAAYYDQVMPNRITLLGRLIQLHRPKAVVCYGRAFWATFRALFSGSAFIREGRFEVSSNQGSRAILTDHFTARTMNGLFAVIAARLRTA